VVSLSPAKYINGATIVNVTAGTVVQFFTLVGYVGRAMLDMEPKCFVVGDVRRNTLEMG
jgi:hypothetical protein